MGTLAAIAAAIVAVVGPVNGGAATAASEPVPPRRSPVSWGVFVAAYTIEVGGQRVLRSTHVAYRGEIRSAEAIALGATRTLRRTRWAVRHHEAWTADSEPGFRDRVEAMASALDAARSLGGTVLDHDPVEVSVAREGVFLGDTLCHEAELRLTAWHEETLVTA